MRMKILALLASLLVLLFYLALMQVNPRYGFFHPRGGMAMLASSLVLANAAIHAATRPSRPLDERFQLGAAGWIWIVVQGGCTAYVCIKFMA